MPALAARPEVIAEQWHRQGPREWERNRRRRFSECAERCGARDAVRLQAGVLLEAAQRRVDVGAEDAVEVARRKAVLRQAELQRGDVPARIAAAEVALAEAVAGEASEGATCPRTDDAVDREPG